MGRWFLRRIAVLAVAGLLGCSDETKIESHAAAPAPGTNVIFMVADGAGFNTWRASALYAGSDEVTFVDGDHWSRTSVCTFPYCEDRLGPGDAPQQDADFVYDSVRAWDATPVGGGPQDYPHWFEGYRWLRRCPDSANTATAMATGQKTYIGAINVDPWGAPIETTLASIADEAGKSVGIVTSVPFGHATPAAFSGVHAVSRGDYARIARLMLTESPADFIAGCGNPDFDESGRPVEAPEPTDYRFVGGREMWRALSGERTLAPGDTVAAEFGEQAHVLTAEQARRLAEWNLVTTRAEIDAFSGAVALPLLIVPEVATTLQQERESWGDVGTGEPFADPLLAGVPTLERLTRLALDSLGADPDGFLLHVEGGAVDWAMHGNEMGRMIEETVAFERAVRCVVEWVERNSDWSKTLLIVTSDHDHMLWGPNAQTVAFEPLEDRGRGRAPGHCWLSDTHSNSLVPAFVRGVGRENLERRVLGRDPVHGAFIDQTALFELAATALAR